MINEKLQCLALSGAQLNRIAANFFYQMTAALAGKKSSLKILSSYLSAASGAEQGKFLALDLGGTNVRVLEIDLVGNRQLEIKRKHSFPLKTTELDYTTHECTGEMLFDYIADELAGFVEPKQTYLLGHTFSFPFSQHKANEAILSTWTKEFKTRDVVGRDVTKLLIQSLKRCGLVQITPKAVMNDTVATLLAASYQQPYVTIGSICGTGHNSCYVETKEQSNVIINLESGNFDGIPSTAWDKLLDSCSAQPGAQLLEKQVSGAYLGKLVGLIFDELVRMQGQDYAHVLLSNQGISLTGEDLSRILSAAQDSEIAKQFLSHGITLTADDCRLLQSITQAVVVRSARLTAASYGGILTHVDPELADMHCIAIDGSLYEKMPGYANELRQALAEIYGDHSKNIILKLVKDGSGMGAAVGAALSC